MFLTFQNGSFLFNPLKSEHADLWLLIFEASQNCTLEARWMRAHGTQTSALARGLEAHAYWQGNSLVDVLAKKGATLHRVEGALREECLALDSQYTSVLEFVCKITIHCIRRSSEVEPELLVRPLVAKRSRLALKAKVLAWSLECGDDRHSLEVSGDRVSCFLCSHSRVGDAGFASLRSEACPGSLRARLAGALLSRTSHVACPAERQATRFAGAHTMRTTGLIRWCEKCGRYTSGKRIIGLAARCNGTPSVGEYGYYQRQRLEKGLHPVSGQSLSRS